MPYDTAVRIYHESVLLVFMLLLFEVVDVDIEVGTEKETQSQVTAHPRMLPHRMKGSLRRYFAVYQITYA